MAIVVIGIEAFGSSVIKCEWGCSMQNRVEGNGESEAT